MHREMDRHTTKGYLLSNAKKLILAHNKFWKYNKILPFLWSLYSGLSWFPETPAVILLPQEYTRLLSQESSSPSRWHGTHPHSFRPLLKCLFLERSYLCYVMVHLHSCLPNSARPTLFSYIALITTAYSFIVHLFSVEPIFVSSYWIQSTELSLNFGWAKKTTM